MSRLREWSDLRKGISMFPPEICDKITVWVRYEELDMGRVTNVRAVLDGCFWEEKSVSEMEKTGQKIKTDISIYIPYSETVTGRKYIEMHEWNSLSPEETRGFWAFDLRRPPLVTKGDNPFEFKWGTPSEVAASENALRASQPQVRQATCIDARLFGPQNMRHILMKV